MQQPEFTTELLISVSPAVYADLSPRARDMLAGLAVIADEPIWEDLSAGAEQPAKIC